MVEWGNGTLDALRELARKLCSATRPAKCAIRVVIYLVFFEKGGVLCSEWRTSHAARGQ